MLGLIFLGLFSLRAMGQETEPENLIIDSIECSGNENTDCEIIKKEIYLNPGDNINEDEIQNAKIRLQLLGLFKSVDLSLSKGSERGHVILKTEVKEASPYFSETTINRTVTFKGGHRNLFGLGKVLQLSFEPAQGVFDNYGSSAGSIEYIDPHLFGQKKYFFNSRLNYFKNENSDNYFGVINETTLDAHIGWRFFDFSYLTAGVYKSIYNVKSYDDSTGLIEKKREERSGYKFNYGWDSEDDSYFPTDGSRFDLTYFKWNDRDDKGQLKTNFKKNWAWDAKNIFAVNLGYLLGLNQYYYHDQKIGMEWNYQIRRGETSRSITDLRFNLNAYITRSISDSMFFSSFKTIETGLLFDTKDFGIIRLSLVRFYKIENGYL